jgi:hypothetical protein
MTQERKAILIMVAALATIVLLLFLFGDRTSPAALTDERLYNLKTAVIAFAESHGEVPSALADLQLDAEALHDHLGEPFRYQRDGTTITITSYGSDKEPGGFFFKRDHVVKFSLPVAD